MLGKVVNVNDDILQVQGVLRKQIDQVVLTSRTLERDAMFRTKRDPRLSDAWFDSVKRSVSELDNAITGVDAAPESAELLNQLRTVVLNAEEQIKSAERIYVGLADLGDEAETLKSPMAEMTRLEERMQIIIETGTGLVHRLRPQDKPSTD